MFGHFWNICSFHKRFDLADGTLMSWVTCKHPVYLSLVENAQRINCAQRCYDFLLKFTQSAIWWWICVCHTASALDAQFFVLFNLFIYINKVCFLNKFLSCIHNWKVSARVWEIWPRLNLLGQIEMAIYLQHNWCFLCGSFQVIICFY